MQRFFILQRAQNDSSGDVSPRVERSVVEGSRLPISASGERKTRFFTVLRSVQNDRGR